MYFNDHAKARRLIREGHCTHFEPALILYFDNEVPIPIRKDRWADYFEFIDEIYNKSANEGE